MNSLVQLSEHFSIFDVYMYMCYAEHTAVLSDQNLGGKNKCGSVLKNTNLT